MWTDRPVWANSYGTHYRDIHAPIKPRQGGVPAVLGYLRGSPNPPCQCVECQAQREWEKQQEPQA